MHELITVGVDHLVDVLGDIGRRRVATRFGDSLLSDPPDALAGGDDMRGRRERDVDDMRVGRRRSLGCALGRAVRGAITRDLGTGR